MPTNGTPASGTWEEAVSVRDDDVVAAELRERFGRTSDRRSVGVTDLVSMRPAFYRVVAPGVPVPPERQVRLDLGRSLHHRLGSRLAGEGILEARVRREGLVGRIDILSDVPIEVKTASSLLSVDDLAAARPEHLEQLAMYSALVARPAGRLLTLLASTAEVSDLQVVDVSFRSTDRILTEMRRRAEQLRAAWADSRATGLPRCPWFGRGCEFEGAGRCDCTGAEPPPALSLTDEVESLRGRDDERGRILAQLGGTLAPNPGVRVGRFRELLYPRRAYFERTAPRPAPEAESPPRPPSPDHYARLLEALESGPAGEVARLPTSADEIEEEVVGFRGRPLLVRTTRARSPIRAEEMLGRSPQYALELGLRCATVGSDSGLVVLGRESAGGANPEIRVFEVRFSSLTPLSRVFRERRRSLLRALESRNPSPLSPCPEWMARDCAYRAECGC